MSKLDVTIIHYFDLEGAIAEISYDNHEWAEITSNEDGLTIKFYSHPNSDVWEFSFDESLEALECAKHRLKKLINQKNSLFPELSDNPEEINKTGEKILKDILLHPEAITYENRYNGRDIFDSLGRGARFDKENNFLGFLQSR